MKECVKVCKMELLSQNTLTTRTIIFCQKRCNIIHNVVLLWSDVLVAYNSIISYTTNRVRFKICMNNYSTDFKVPVCTYTCST